MGSDRARLFRRAAAASALATAGCATLLGGDEGVLDDFDAGVDGGHDAAASGDTSSGGDANSEPETSPPFDAGIDASPPDAAVDAACPGDGGPVAVRVGAFCVDSTEVTNAQYQTFLSARGADVSGQPASCLWNTTFTPSTWPLPAEAANLPVSLVDWCDAFAFCAWAGKRLCGAIDGGAAGFDDAADAAASQWSYACSHGGDGLHAYPYGNTYLPSACNGMDANDAGKLVDAGSEPGCVGGFPGVFDLSGNVREWEDSCMAADAAAPEADDCRTRGGAATDDAGLLMCARPSSRQRNAATQHTGFRCCGP